MLKKGSNRSSDIGGSKKREARQQGQRVSQHDYAERILDHAQHNRRVA